jgi:hypothetical protein
MKHIKLYEDFVNEGLSKSEINQIENYLDKYVDEDALFDMCNDFYTDDNEWHDIKNDLDKADLIEWAISCFKTNGFKLKDVKTIFESTINEAKVGSYAIKIGSILKFRDGETWKVTKFIGSPSNPRGVFALPHGETKDSYVSVALEFKMEELEKTVESVTESASFIAEAKILTRDEMMQVMRNKYGLSFIKTTEEFDGEEGGIWLGGSEGLLMPNAKDDMFNYYHGGSKYPHGIHKDLAKFLDKCGWYGQFYDPGTIMLWPR